MKVYITPRISNIHLHSEAHLMLSASNRETSSPALAPERNWDEATTWDEQETE